MKMRIQGDSLRLRVRRSELDRLLAGGRVEETVHFPGGPAASLTYTLEVVNGDRETSVRYGTGEIAVAIAAADACVWSQEDKVGIYKELHHDGGIFSLTVEKDFACLDSMSEDQSDAFENPRRATVC